MAEKKITYADIQGVNEGLTLTDIGRGNMYAEVPQRVQAFRKLFPMGTITTDILYMEGGVVVMKAVASVDGVVLGEGLAYEKESNGFINKNSYIENCQTSAVGRALAFIGIGSDKSIASAEEVANAKKQQAKDSEDEMKAELKKLLEDSKRDVTAFLKWCTERYERKIESVDMLVDVELKDAIKAIKGDKKGDK